MAAGTVLFAPGTRTAYALRKNLIKNGLLHGVCRQWNEAGRLLGKYRMVHGTGIQREWHDNGKLQMEVSTVRGEFMRTKPNLAARWDTLLSERFYLRGQVVSAEAYREAAAKDQIVAEISRQARQAAAKNRERPFTFTASLWIRFWRNAISSEARKWLAKKTGDKTARSLGRFKRENDAAKFVEALYQAGAVEVIVPDIYRNKARDQFADCLLVQLPKSAAKRKAIRKVCAQLRTRKLGAVQPDEDIGESHLYLSLA